MFKALAIVAAQAAALPFIPPIRLWVNAVGRLCPVDPEGYPEYNASERFDDDVSLYDTESPS